MTKAILNECLIFYFYTKIQFEHTDRIFKYFFLKYTFFFNIIVLYP